MVYKQENFTPVNDYILLEPLKVKEIYQEIEVPDEEKNKGKKIHELKETKKVKNKIKVEHRVGKIISMSKHHQDQSIKSPYKVGDYVSYNYRNAKPFDLLAKKDPDLKCPVLIRHWDVTTIVENDKLN